MRLETCGDKLVRSAIKSLAKAIYGVARFDTSLVMISIPRCLATPTCERKKANYQMRIPSDGEDTYFAVERTKINTDDSHGGIRASTELKGLQVEGK